MKIRDILTNVDFTMDEFWVIVDALPDEVAGKKQKANINAYFKKNGDPKVKALSLSTDEDYQTWHDTQGFIRRQVRTQIHVNKLKKRRDDILGNIKDVKRKKDLENGQ